MLVLAVLLAGCAGPVKIPPPQPKPQVRKLCARLAQRLPQQLGERERRPTQPDSPLVAAWGDPPVALRCGVGRPDALRPTSRLAVVNGVEWLPESAPKPRRFVTVHRAAYVQVIMPERTGVPAGDVLVNLADPIKATIPKGTATLRSPANGGSAQTRGAT